MKLFTSLRVYGRLHRRFRVKSSLNVVYRHVLVICNLILEILSFLRLVLAAVGMWACYPCDVSKSLYQKKSGWDTEIFLEPRRSCHQDSTAFSTRTVVFLFWLMNLWNSLHTSRAFLYTLQHLKGPSRNSSSSRCCCSCSRWGLLQAQEDRQGQERSRTIGNMFVVI